MRVFLLLSITLLLSGCSEQTSSLVEWLVLLPFLLVMLVLWVLNRNRGEESWDEEHFPDEDDDDNEDHHLM